MRPTQRVSTLLAALPIFALLLAGCTQGPPAGCADAQCGLIGGQGAAGAIDPKALEDGGAAPPAMDPFTVLPAPPVGLNRTLQFEACRGVAGLPQVLREPVREIVPDAFVLWGYTSETASLLYLGLMCPRAVVNDTVYENAWLLEVSVFVEPVAKNWTDRPFSRYLLGVFASPPAYAAALMGFGLPAAAAETSELSLPYGEGPGAHTWRFAAANGTFELDYRTTGVPDIHPEGRHSLWAGLGPFLRTDADLRYVYDLMAEQGTIRSQGPSAVSRVLGPLAIGDSRPLHAFDSTWVVREDLYG